MFLVVSWTYTLVLRGPFFRVPEFNLHAQKENKIWNKTEKSNKIEQDKRSLISTFAFFLTTIIFNNQFNFWNWAWGLGYVFILIWDFSNIT